ncbi:serine protease Do [Pustulibacterium marinum]|uniref:Serine protease Do n=1 Tax=Pustulibacterium marinum TaxID=1224947 RepID=A0A1I7I262_9FLAO|nr:trypsin-like peptidase domain-containing protein [Pustulibacterium marinum]SFU67042.1 serine protease Do [Pustulibacterium marinum]
MTKKIFFSLIVVVNGIFGYSQNNLRDLTAKNEKAIFSIFTYDDFGVPSGSGTGFFINSNGIGISNFHVLVNASKAIIKTNNKKSYKVVEILESNSDADLIKFRVENSENISFPFLNLKNTGVNKGEDIFVIGNPHGFESTVSEGIISSIREVDGYEKVIQITAPISPGSSGSPVMTMDGNVIGVATFQYKEGQNLNFAVSANMISKLNPINKNLTASNNSNFIVINERCQDNSELVLNSLEFKDYETVLNFSFTNVSMGYGEYMLIWSKMNTTDETFFIQDLKTMEKYYAKNSSIGSSRENGTTVALGETKRFKIIFPPIPKTVTRMNIMEGISSSWNFMDLDLSKYLNIENQETENYDVQFALTKLENKEFKNAQRLLSDKVETDKSSHSTYNVMGILSYLMDNNYDALNYLSKAIEINPRNDIYYFNRYRVYLEKKQDYDKALEDISYAIRNRPNQGDYYQHRAYVYMIKKDWKKAKSDLDLAINFMGENWQLLKLRGNCKTWLNDMNGACSDWNDSYRLSNYTDSELKSTIKKYCK